MDKQKENDLRKLLITTTFEHEKVGYIKDSRELEGKGREGRVVGEGGCRLTQVGFRVAMTVCQPSGIVSVTRRDWWEVSWNQHPACQSLRAHVTNKLLRYPERPVRHVARLISCKWRPLTYFHCSRTGVHSVSFVRVHDVRMRASVCVRVCLSVRTKSSVSAHRCACVRRCDRVNKALQLGCETSSPWCFPPRSLYIGWGLERYNNEGVKCTRVCLFSTPLSFLFVKPYMPLVSARNLCSFILPPTSCWSQLTTLVVHLCLHIFLLLSARNLLCWSLLLAQWLPSSVTGLTSQCQGLAL